MPVNSTTIAVLLAARLIQHAPLTTLIADRLRPQAVDQSDVWPAVTYAVMTTSPNYHLQGEDGSAETRVEFVVCSESYDEMNLIGNIIADQLAGFAGFLGKGDDRQRVYDCVRDNDFDRLDPPVPGDARWRYRRVIDFLVNHSTPVPSLDLA